MEGTDVVIVEGGVFKRPIDLKRGWPIEGYAEQSQFSPVSVRYCSVPKHNAAPEPTLTHEIAIEYSPGEGGLNLAVTAHVGESLSDFPFLAYWFRFPVLSESYDGLREVFHESEVRYIAMSDPRGSHVMLPVAWTYKHCHMPIEAMVAVRPVQRIPRGDGEQKQQQQPLPDWMVPGSSIDRVHYGFVDPETPQDALQAAPWYNAVGSPQSEAALMPVLSAGYKRLGFMVSMWLRVPNGKQAVFRLECHNDAGEHFESPVFFA